MNKTFKVARSLTRGTVVTSEKASSYQGKAVKTVIAAAVALVAGSALAATAYSDVTVSNGATVVFENGKITIQGAGATGVKDGETKATDIADKTEITFKDASVPVFKGGSIVVNAAYDQTTDVVDQSTTDFGTAAVQTTGNISVNAYKGAGKDATLKLQNIGISEGAISFDILPQVSDDKTDADKVKTGAATLSAGTVTLGSYSGKPELGTVVSKQVSVKNVKDLTATVNASTGNLTLANVAVDNAGALNFTATAGNVDVQRASIVNADKLTFNAVAGNVTIDKDVAFQNTGVVTVEAKGADQTATFAADYDGATGVLNIDGTKVAVTGNVKADNIVIGKLVDVTKDSTDKNTVGLSGAVTIGNVQTVNGKDVFTGSLTAGKTLTLESGFTNATSVVAAETVVTGAKVAVTNGDKATMDLGNLSIDTGKALTLTNNNEKSAIKAGKLTLVGTLTVSGQEFELTGEGSTNTGTINVNDTGVFTLGGALANSGTVAFGAAGSKLVVEGSLENAGTAAKIGTDKSSGSLVVAGTLTNKANIAVQNVSVSGKLSNQYAQTTPSYTGKVEAVKLTVEKGGVVESEIASDKYVVGTTTIEEGGAFVTKLNGSVAGSTTKNALSGFGKFELNGGVLGTAADSQITNFDLVSGDSLTLNASYDLDTVETAAANNLIVGEDGVVSVQSLTANVTGAVSVSGTLSTSLKAVNAKTDEKGDVVDVDATNKKISVGQGALALNSDATLQLDVGADKLSKTGVATIKSWVNNTNGLIDLGSVAIEDLTATNGEIKVGDLVDLDGITTDTLKSSRITEIEDAITKTASYGAVELKGKAEDKGVLEIGDTTGGATLTLNGLGDSAVNLVQYSDDKVAGVTLAHADSKLVTKGNGKIGAIQAADTSTGSLIVAANALTVDG